MARGKLITVEGLDGAGKTTLVGLLEQALRARGIEVRILREPGGVPVAERVRSLVKDPDLEVGARAEALLYAAARAQLVEQAVEPLLAAGSWVLLDRFVDSSLAYQGGGRRLGIEPIAAVNAFATGGLSPDRTLLLMLDPTLGRTRSLARAEPVDRLEGEGENFFDRIAAAYTQLATADPDRIRIIDASRTPQEVAESALAELADLL